MTTMMIRAGLWVSSSGDYQIKRVKRVHKQGLGFYKAPVWKVYEWNPEGRQYEEIEGRTFATLNEARLWVSLLERAPF